MVIDDLPEFVAACCLHNVCKSHGDSFDEDWMQDVTDHHSVSGGSTSSVCNSGKDIREALMTLVNTTDFSSLGIVWKS